MTNPFKDEPIRAELADAHQRWRLYAVAFWIAWIAAVVSLAFVMLAISLPLVWSLCIVAFVMLAIVGIVVGAIHVALLICGH
jgi:hypothetical protein